MTGAVDAPPVPEPARPAIACARCGAEVLGDQSWCTECGLAARTRLAGTPNWRTPLVAAGVIGLAAIVALIVAFLVLTGDNAPLPTTAAPAATAPAATPPAATPPATTPAAPATTAPPAATTPPATGTPPPAATTTVPPATVPATTVATTATAPTGAE